MSVRNLTESDFSETVQGSDLPVLVDFWAEWCGPCKAVAPVLDEISEGQADIIQVAKLNVDDARSVAQTLGIMSIPTMILFRDSEEIDRLVGAHPKNNIVEFLNSHLN